MICKRLSFTPMSESRKCNVSLFHFHLKKIIFTHLTNNEKGITQLNVLGITQYIDSLISNVSTDDLGTERFCFFTLS